MSCYLISCHCYIWNKPITANITDVFRTLNSLHILDWNVWMDWLKLIIHLDGQGLSVSNHSAQLNHRLHLRDSVLNALVNHTLPEKKRKKKTQKENLNLTILKCHCMSVCHTVYKPSFLHIFIWISSKTHLTRLPSWGMETNSPFSTSMRSSAFYVNCLGEVGAFLQKLKGVFQDNGG